MNHQETCRACDEAYVKCQVDALREASNEAFRTSEKAKIAYIDARDAYHKIYRNLWGNYKT